MDLNNLVGQTYKYKELCALLGEKELGGDSKKAQLKRWERLFSWEHPINVKTRKPSKLFYIKEIYSEAKEKQDGRKNNGKSEASLKALEENRHEQQSFFNEDELQLAILWLLGNQGASSRWKETSKRYGYVLANELYVAIGLCNEYYNMITRQKYYYCKNNTHDERPTVYNLWQVDLAYKDVYRQMKQYSITAFNQLQRKKVLEFTYWKLWSNGEKETTFTDEQMATFVGARQDTLELWNDTHKTKQFATVGDFYDKGNAIEIKEFEDSLLELLKETEEFKGIEYYATCFRIYYDLRTIKAELKRRGFNVGKTKDEFRQAFAENMADVVARINEKFIERHEVKIDKKREEHFEKFEQYEQEMIVYNQQVEEECGARRGFGKRLEAQKPKKQYFDLVDDGKYKETKDILHLGLSHELDEDLNGTVLTIKSCIKANKPSDK